MTPTDRIKQEAEAAATKQNEVLPMNEVYIEGYEDGYIAGATATHDRAKVLVDALEAFISWQGPGMKNWPIVMQARKALEQWEGKEEGEKRVKKEKWMKATATWNSYPAGTKAKALNGGYWIKIPCGRWQWPGGCSFPTPGGDATGEVCIPE